MDEREIEINIDTSDKEPVLERHKFGIWGGVVAPCLQNMVGITMFLRMPWITGQAGIGLTLLILCVCLSTSIITTLSISAVVTNGKISRGGCYYVLTRSLGPSLGGSVGTLYFFGQVTSSSLYIIGAVELFIETSGDEIINKGSDLRILGVIVCIILWLLNVGVNKYIKKITIFCICMLALSMICIYIGISTAGVRSGLSEGITGLSPGQYSSNFEANYDSNIQFHELIAIFYPAVIGFFSGTSKSQELHNPSRAVPYGTLLAIVIASMIYISIIMMIGSSCDRSELKGDLSVLFNIAWPTPFLVTSCVIVVTTGAALQCMSGAHEVLYSMARDNLFPLKLCRSESVSLHITAVLVAGLVTIGSINSISPVITMFFLLFDASMNIACVLLSLLNNPSWRPAWPYYHWSIALCGSILCFIIMLYINWWAALIAFFLLGVLYV